MSTKLPTKRLTANLPNVKRTVGLFTRQRQPAEVDESWCCCQLTTNQSFRCILCEPYLNIAHGYVNNIRW